MDQQTQLLFRALADHLDAIAETLRSFGEQGSTGPASRPTEAPTPAPEAARLDPEDAIAKAKAIHPLLGSHQELVIRALASAHPNALSVSKINPNFSSQPNTYMTIDKLEELELVRRDGQTHPRRHLLGPRIFD